MNKKILISLLIIGAVAAVAIGGTIAFFSDKETSKNNILIAGDIDLKVDHTLSYYNGLFCDNDYKLRKQCDMGNLVKNGSFELPEVTNSAKWDIFPAGYAGLDWSIDWMPGATSYGGYNRPKAALREYQEGVNGWSAQHGDQWAELDSDWVGPNVNLNGEPALVRIYQDIQTLPGKTYEISFWSRMRPDSSSAESKMDVKWGGATVANITENGGWTNHKYTVTATGYATRLAFEGTGNNNSLGIFLDNVSVIAKECTETNDLVGHTCAPTFSERDLTEEKFFNFDDVKPGDFGRNIISLHVFSNDSWACMDITSKTDDENVCVKPEEKAGDDINSPVGELSKYINIFVWRDNNDNGVYEPASETPIYTGKIADANRLAVYDSATAEYIPAGDMKFIGLAWCAGNISVDSTTGAISCDHTGMGNDAQTDKFMADLSIYAEQKRNNENFTCIPVIKD